MGRTRNTLPSPAALVESGAGELNDLAQLLAAATAGESVHGARRRIKQVRSLLRLVRSALGDDDFRACNTALREAADALAGHRRAEALVSAAAKLPHAQDGAFWRERAEDHRAAQAANGDPAAALATARGAIGRASMAFRGALPLRGDGSVAERFLDSYAKARRRLRKGLKSKDTEQLHEARKYVIHHLHHLKLLRPVDTERLRALEELREGLGDLNDLAELEQLGAAASPPRDAVHAMRKARRCLMDRVEAATDRLFSDTAKRLAKRLGHAAEPRSRRRRLALQAGE